MNLVEMYRRYPTDEECIRYIEDIRWKGVPICPYCHSAVTSPIPEERRHHCNTCNTTFSVTVRTLFHRTRVPLQKWFLAISLALNPIKGVSARELARQIHVNKDTAWSMKERIQRAMLDDRDLVDSVAELADRNASR